MRAREDGGKRERRREKRLLRDGQLTSCVYSEVYYKIMIKVLIKDRPTRRKTDTSRLGLTQNFFCKKSNS